MLGESVLVVIKRDVQNSYRSTLSTLSELYCNCNWKYYVQNRILFSHISTLSHIHNISSVYISTFIFEVSMFFNNRGLILCLPTKRPTSDSFRKRWLIFYNVHPNWNWQSLKRTITSFSYRYAHMQLPYRLLTQ